MSTLDLVCARSKEKGFDPHVILGRSRLSEHVKLRAAIARELRGDPWNLSLPAIGRALNRHHTSILNLLGQAKQKTGVTYQALADYL